MADLSPNPSLRILMACDTFTPNVNGAARFAERLAAGLIERGHQVHIMAPTPKGVTPGVRYEVVEGVEMPVHRVKSHKLWGHSWVRFVMPWRASREAAKLIQTIQPDVLHAQSHILIGRGAVRQASQAGINIVSTNHIMPENILDPNTPKWFRVPFLKWAWWDVERILSKAAHITTPTRRAADFLERNTNRKDVTPVSCGINQSQYTPRFGPRTSNRIVFVGRVNHEKQIDVILRALTHLPKELNVQFDVVGIGDQRDTLKALAASLGVADQVVWHGKLPDDELRMTLTNASVFAIASIAELQSIATLEAMASGLPVVAANAMALPHLVREGENGYLFEPGNDRELAQRITQILQLTPERYEAMQQASLAMVEGHDIERTLDTFERLYRGER